MVVIWNLDANQHTKQLIINILIMLTKGFFTIYHIIDTTIDAYNLRVHMRDYKYGVRRSIIKCCLGTHVSTC